MESRATPEFWAAYRRLPKEVQRQARKAYRFFRSNTRHQSLDFTRIRRRRAIFSAMVTDDYRAVCRLEGNAFVWFWIGPHAEYNLLLRRV